MKRKIIKSSIALLCLSGGIYFHFAQPEKDALNDLAFENIEALALTEEDPNENYRCYGWGDVDCHGYKVEVKFGGLR